MVGEHPVVLLGHPPVEGPQARLEMGDGQVQFHRGERAGEGRVGVAVDEGPVRPVGVEDALQRGEHAAGLDSVRPAAHSEVDIRVGDPQIGEEGLRHQRVVVLARVGDDMLHAGRGERGGDRGELDELGAGADDAEHLHPASLESHGVPEDPVGRFPGVRASP